MCGRFVLAAPASEIEGLFASGGGVEVVARFNIAPTQPIVAVWSDGFGRQVRLARWGLVPGWVRDPREFPLLINARGETMADKPAFRDSVRHKRCIVPASGYYEWQKGPGGAKTPFYLTRADGALMAMAGLYSTWQGPQGEEVDTVAIVTTAASPDLAHIHERMPAILESADVDAWLDVRGVGASEAMKLIRPAPEGTLRFHPVSDRVNGAANDDPGLIVPGAVRPVQPAPPRPGEQFDLF